MKASALHSSDSAAVRVWLSARAGQSKHWTQRRKGRECLHSTGLEAACMCNQMLRHGQSEHQTLCSKFKCMLGSRQMDVGVQMVCYCRTTPAIKCKSNTDPVRLFLITFGLTFKMALHSWQSVKPDTDVRKESEGMKRRSNRLTWDKSDVVVCCAMPACANRTSLSPCARMGVYMYGISHKMIDILEQGLQQAISFREEVITTSLTCPRPVGFGWWL